MSLSDILSDKKLAEQYFNQSRALIIELVASLERPEELTIEEREVFINRSKKVIFE